jgi:hypothetical protein
MAVNKRVLNENGGGNMTGYSGQWKALYDERNLYLLVDVNKPTAHNQFYTYDVNGNNWWQGSDAIEVYFDGNNEKSSSYDSNDFQLVFIHNSDPKAGSGNPNMRNVVSMYSASTSDSYFVEIKIPWLNLKITPEERKVIGFDLAITISRGANSTGRVAQYATFSNHNQMFTNTSQFGNVTMKTCDRFITGFTPPTNENKTPSILSKKDRVEISGLKTGDKIAIYTILGIKKYALQATQETEIINSLDSGIYIVAIEGKKIAEKVMIIK